MFTQTLLALKNHDNITSIEILYNLQLELAQMTLNCILFFSNIVLLSLPSSWQSALLPVWVFFRTPPLAVSNGLREAWPDTRGGEEGMRMRKMK